MCLVFFFFFFSVSQIRWKNKSKGAQEHLVPLTSTGIVVWSAFDSKYVQCKNAQYIFAEIEMSDISVLILDEVMQWCKCLYSK